MHTVCWGEDRYSGREGLLRLELRGAEVLSRGIGRWRGETAAAAAAAVAVAVAAPKEPNLGEGRLGAVVMVMVIVTVIVGLLLLCRLPFCLLVGFIFIVCLLIYVRSTVQ